MTRILVVGDSHGEAGLLRAVLSKHGAFDLLLHLGDGYGDPEAAEAGNLPFIGVRGNMDFPSMPGAPMPAETRRLNIENFDIFITHGHKHKVHNGFEIIKKEKADIVLFGHTHVQAMFRENGVLYFNPGALKNGEYGILELDKGNPVKTELTSLLK